MSDEVIKPGSDDPMAKRDAMKSSQEVLSEEEWNIKHKEIYRLVDEINQEIDRIHGSDDIKYTEEYDSIMEPIKKKIKASGLDTYKYVSWHAIVGGGINQEAAPYIDFSGDLSIEHYLKDKLYELKKR